MEHIIKRHLFIAWQCLAPGHRHVLFNNAGILQCLPFIMPKVENRDQKPLALKHELCRPMTVKRDMSFWIGEKDFAGCPSNATVFSFPTFSPWEFFKEGVGVGGVTGWPPVGEGLFYGWSFRVAEQIKLSTAGRLMQAQGWESPSASKPWVIKREEKSRWKGKAYVWPCVRRRKIFCAPLAGFEAGVSKVHFAYSVKSNYR